MKQFLIWIMFLFLGLLVQGQNNLIAVEKNNTLSGSYSYYATDSFQYVYAVQGNVFSKTLHKEQLEYKNISLGKITKVDIQNPLKLMLYYEDFNTVVLLDNQLNETQKIDFSQESVPMNVTAMGIASLNQLWVYNSLNQHIGLYDYLKKTYKTVGTPLTTKINYYATDFNSFVWIDENNQGYACSIFGNITPLGEFPAADQLQIISSNSVFFSQGDALFYLSRQKDSSWLRTKISLTEKRFQNFYYQAQNLAIFTAEGISNFKIILP
ncbi:hypothetical protein BXU11_15570 [Flavobacterium sp. LM5]|uniref:hypothetical protein n=1 Tax=Flavobacterium sp. LM5 TaxID=1938610 RepID=UPI00099294AB|nr:hypothetical protein [Flavobacterium sp. LM5]OOV25509.1 hypothetical protein BXU11_15570 [Flavobacterium sp. LM5]